MLYFLGVILYFAWLAFIIIINFFLVLRKVKSFLPLMHEADVKLQEDLRSLPAGSLDIENVDNTAGHVVAMVSYA